MTAIELAYRERGSGTPVVLLHAFPLSSALFDEIGELAGYRLVLPDLRGFGKSPLGHAEPSLAAMAGDVVALMDRLDLPAAVLGGVSMGGYVAMEVMRQAPQRLTGVLLIDTKAEADEPAAREVRLRMAEAVLAEGRPVLEPMMAGLLGPTSHESRPKVVSRVSQWLDDAQPAAVAWAQRAMAGRPSSFDTLSASGVQGEVIVGDEDALSPLPAAHAMADTLGTQARVVPAVGHLAVVEDAAATRAQMLKALATLTG